MKAELDGGGPKWRRLWFRQSTDRDEDSEALWTGDLTIGDRCDWNIDELLL